MILYQRSVRDQEWEERLRSSVALLKQDLIDTRLERISTLNLLHDRDSELHDLRKEVNDLRNKVGQTQRALDIETAKLALSTESSMKNLSPMPTLLRVHSEQSKLYKSLQEVRFRFQMRLIDYAMSS